MKEEDVRKRRRRKKKSKSKEWDIGDLHENYHISVSVKSMSKTTEDLINWLLFTSFSIESQVAKFHWVVVFWCTHTPTDSWKDCVFCVPTNFPYYFICRFLNVYFVYVSYKSCSTAVLQKSAVPSSRNQQVWQFSLPDVGWSLPFLGLCASWAVPRDSSCLELEKK